MKLVIDIEEGRYNWIISHASNDPRDYADTTDIVFRKAVERGIPLPRDHGDLIDRDIAYAEFDKASCSYEGQLLKYIPAVIKSNKR